MSIKEKIKNNIPNALSTLRLGMAASMLYFFSFLGGAGKVVYYAVGDATDMLDGFLARRLPNRSKYCKAYGKVVDPIADKSFNIMALLIAIVATPVLLPILAFESMIAGATVARALHIIKAEGINLKDIKYIKKNKNTDDISNEMHTSILRKILTFFIKMKDIVTAFVMENVERCKMILNTIDEMHVSILGKIKSFSIFTAITSALIAPSSLPITLTFAGITTFVFELPLLHRYNLERKVAKITSRLNNNKYDPDEIDTKTNKLEKAKAKIKKFDNVDMFILNTAKKSLRLFKKKDSKLKPNENIDQSKEQTEAFTGEIQSEENLTKDKKENTSIVTQDLNFYKYLKYILENGQNLQYEEYAQSLKNLEYDEYVETLKNDNLVYSKHK